MSSHAPAGEPSVTTRSAPAEAGSASGETTSSRAPRARSSQAPNSPAGAPAKFSITRTLIAAGSPPSAAPHHAEAAAAGSNRARPRSPPPHPCQRGQGV